jgi:hypothetical protein
MLSGFDVVEYFQVNGSELSQSKSISPAITSSALKHGFNISNLFIIDFIICKRIS